MDTPRRKLERGQSLAEFAVVLPLLMLLVFGVVEFGSVMKSYIQLTNASREAARYAALGSTAGAYPANCKSSGDATVVGRACEVLGGLKLANVSNVAVTYPQGNVSGNKVVVTVTYVYHYFTPVGGIIGFFGGESKSTLTLNSSTTMRLE
ncbi:MAG TPA: TadE family protein [Dehalococcoidia bacterium]|nr:TadE family protein [Dehalococcoidia bacterium]